MSTLNPIRLEEAILRRLRTVVPENVQLTGGLIGQLLESWDVSSEWIEALEFVSRRFLEEQQEDVILQLHEGWPSPTGTLPEPEVQVMQDDEVIRLYFATDDAVILTLPDVPFEEFS